MNRLTPFDLAELYRGFMSWQSPDGEFHERRNLLPAHLGQGVVRSIKLNENMHLMLSDQVFAEDLRINAPRADWPLEFIFTYGGNIQTAIEDIGNLGPFTNHAAVLYMPERHARMELAGEVRHQSVSIKLNPSYVKRWLENDSPIIEDILRALEEKTPLIHQRPLLPAQQLALFQLLQCSLTGSASRLYLESKSLELIALLLGSLHEAPNSACKLREGDIEKIHLARDILLQNPADPPSLRALARQVGTNEFKLKSGFKSIFGTTVFAYVRQQRMEQARVLLACSDSSVTQVALQVGYASPGHFVEAFKAQFGITPGRLRART